MVAQNPKDNKWYVIYKGKPVAGPFASKPEAEEQEYQLMSIHQMGAVNQSNKGIRRSPKTDSDWKKFFEMVNLTSGDRRRVPLTPANVEYYAIQIENDVDNAGGSITDQEAFRIARAICNGVPTPIEQLYPKKKKKSIPTRIKSKSGNVERDRLAKRTREQLASNVRNILSQGHEDSSHVDTSKMSKEEMIQIILDAQEPKSLSKRIKSLWE